jgi:hypothetical protein
MLSNEKNNRSEAVETAHSELLKAVDLLNGVELTVDGELDVSSQDFNGYSPEDVTGYTETATGALADDDSDVGNVLSVVAMVLEETAYQYEAIDGLFETFAEYELQLYNNDYQNAIRASNRFVDYHTEFVEHGSTITENLALLKNKGYEEPVGGFSIQTWSQEQSRFIKLSKVMRSLKSGFGEQARGLLRLRRASIERNNGRYDNGLEEVRIARNRFEKAEESFSLSLKRGLTYRRALIKDFTCLSRSYLDATDLGITALEAYASNNNREGDEMWKNMNKQLQAANEECSA